MEKNKKAEIEYTLKMIKQFPDNRKFFLNTGLISIEVTKEEALKLLEEMLNQLERKK